MIDSNRIQRFFKRFSHPTSFIFGTLIVLPFRPVSLTTFLTLPAAAFAALEIFLGVFFAAVAAFLALVVVFLAEVFAAVAAFLALAGAFLAAALALVVVFLAEVFTLLAAFAAAMALLATAALTLGSADKLPFFESVFLATIHSPMPTENGAHTSIL